MNAINLTPSDTWDLIFQYMNHRDLGRSIRVNRTWRRYISKEKFQKQLYMSASAAVLSEQVLQRFNWTQINRFTSLLYNNLELNFPETATIELNPITSVVSKVFCYEKFLIAIFCDETTCIWNFNGNEVSRLEATETLLCLDNNRLLIFDSNKTSILQFRNFAQTESKFLFCPEGWSFYKNMKACFINDNQALVLLKRNGYKKFEFKFFIVDLSTKGFRPADDKAYETDETQEAVQKLLNSLVMGVDHNMIRVAQIHDEKIMDFKVIKEGLLVITKDEVSNQYKLYRFDMRVDTYNVTPFQKAITMRFSNHILITQTETELHFFNLVNNTPIGSVNLKDILTKHPTTSNFEYGYIQGHAFFLINTKESKTYLYKINVNTKKTELIKTESMIAHLWISDNRVVVNFKIMHQIFNYILHKQYFTIFDYACKGRI